MPFHFSLAVLLHHRQSVEQRCELALIAAVQQVQLVQNEIDAAHQQLRTIAIEGSRSLLAGVAAAELQFDLLRRTSLDARIDHLHQKLQAAQERRNLAQLDLREALRQWESVDIIHQQQLDEYLLNEKRKDQRRIDDLFLLRRRPTTGG